MRVNINSKQERTASIMYEIANLLIDDLQKRLSSEGCKVWRPVPQEIAREQVLELGITVVKQHSGDFCIFCEFKNKTELYGGSRFVMSGTIEDMKEWIANKNTILEDVAFKLLDLYENTYTWD